MISYFKLMDPSFTAGAQCRARHGVPRRFDRFGMEYNQSYEFCFDLVPELLIRSTILFCPFSFLIPVRFKQGLGVGFGRDLFPYGSQWAGHCC